MNSYQNIKTSYIDFQTGACSCCFDKFQPVDYQYIHKTSKSAPFTGKELDSETGYSYFGARYYDAELSGLFFSVDPMADKYPSIGPYAYCTWNPVKLMDPNGCSVDEWDYNTTTGKIEWVSERGRDKNTDYINIVDSYGGYYGSYVGSGDYSFSVTQVCDEYGNSFTNIETINMDFTLFHPGFGDNSFSEVLPSVPSSNSLPCDLWNKAKTAAFAIDAFTSTQNSLIEYLAANKTKNISQSLGKSVGMYNAGIKGLGYAGSITTIGASVMQGYNYYNNGGNNWLIGVKLGFDVGMSVVSNIGIIGMALGFTYSLLDVCTNGFGTNNELRKYSLR